MERKRLARDVSCLATKTLNGCHFSYSWLHLPSLSATCLINNFYLKSNNFWVWIFLCCQWVTKVFCDNFSGVTLWLSTFSHRVIEMKINSPSFLANQFSLQFHEKIKGNPFFSYKPYQKHNSGKLVPYIFFSVPNWSLKPNHYYWDSEYRNVEINEIGNEQKKPPAGIQFPVFPNAIFQHNASESVGPFDYSRWMCGLL